MDSVSAPAATEQETQPEKQGCGSTVGVSIASSVTVMLCGTVLLRKKKD